MEHLYCCFWEVKFVWALFVSLVYVSSLWQLFNLIITVFYVVFEAADFYIFMILLFFSTPAIHRPFKKKNYYKWKRNKDSSWAWVSLIFHDVL